MALVVNAGIAVADTIYYLDVPLVAGHKHRAARMAQVVGGNGAIAALAIARLGGAAHLLTRTGADDAGDAIRATLGADGVMFDLSPPMPGQATSRSTIVIEPDGERTIVNFLDADFPDRPAWMPPALPVGTGVVLGDVRWETGTRHLFDLARKIGAATVFDGDRKPIDSMLMTYASHCVFSAQGLREITGIDDLGDALHDVARRLAGFVAVTDGARGVLALNDGKAMRFPAFPVQAVDTLGAGDVWHGAFALALAEGQPVARAIVFASAAAALKCTARGGGMAAPHRDAVERLIAGHAMSGTAP